jgi:methionyl-tRNA formyltransferase
MSNYVILSEKEWHINSFLNLKNLFQEHSWTLIDSKSDFNLENLKKINPQKIFIPHWSYLIPSSIYNSYECIVFHMTDLPFGRGGSPLQNLIISGLKETKISAIKVEEGIDTGDIYIKKPLSLKGTAKQIFIESSIIIEKMIIEILQNDLSPTPQTGQIIEFKRRKPEEGDISNLKNIQVIYDYIRMLDCEGYQSAFIENDEIKIEFTNAELKSENTIIANVRIFKK